MDNTSVKLFYLYFYYILPNNSIKMAKKRKKERKKNLAPTEIRTRDL